jgi:membrane protease YdiL (CAAX protease family)
MDKFPHWVDHIVAFLFCVVLPLYAALKRRKGDQNFYFTSAEKKNIYISGSFSLFVMGVIVIAVWLLFKRPIADIGLTQPVNFRSWWWLVVIFIIIYLGDAFVSLYYSKKSMDETIEHWKKRTPFLPTKKNELPEYLLLCFSAGVFEEIVYRGYLVTYCLYLFEGSAYQNILAVSLPAFVFALAHFYQGAKAVLKIFVLAIFFGYLFINSGSLLIVMILHFLVDAAGGFLTMKYIKEPDPPVVDPDPPIENEQSAE